MTKKAGICSLLLVTGLGAVTVLSDIPDRDDLRHANLAAVNSAFERDTKRFENNPDVWVLPGVTADRSRQLVSVAIEATGIESGAVEFIVIGPESGHDYEAIAVALAKPGDIRKAVEFIGVPAGDAVHHETMRFWPKGERVFADIVYTDHDGEERSVPVEHMIKDTRTDDTLPREGFVFTGSHTITLPGKEDPVLACDFSDPHAVIANYNERNALFDLPRQAFQRDVYDFQVANPHYVLPAGSMVRLDLKPELREREPRVLDAELRVTARPEFEGDGPGSLVFSLTATDGAEQLGAAADYKEMATTLTHLRDNGQRDVFVKIAFSPELTVHRLARLAEMLATMETQRLIRAEPPAEDELFYKAYHPNQAHRDRAKRFLQPWELLIDADTDSAVLVKIEQDWEGEALDPVLRTFAYPVTSGADVQTVLSEKGAGLPAVLVFASPATTHAQILALVREVRDTHPYVHVFEEAAPLARAGITSP